MTFLIFLVVWIVFVAAAIVSAAQRKKTHTLSDDGHVVPPSEDLTCENLYGHDHGSFSGEQRRYVVHEEPEEGYVILNGVKRKLKDCKDL